MRSSTGINRLLGSLVGGLLFALSTAALSETVVTPGSKAAGLDSCVAPTAEMRRYHMLYLTHDRNATVREGRRDIQNSLAECVDCHAAKDEKGGYVPVNTEGQFCESCHNYTAVNVTCFQCHRKVPGEKHPDLGSLTGGSVDGTGHALGLLLDAGEAPSLTTEEYTRLHAIVGQED